MSAKIGNATDGNSYSNNIGVTPVKPAGKVAGNAKSEFQTGSTAAVSDIFPQIKKSASSGEPVKEDIDKGELEAASEELSKVVQSMGANLAFAVHEETNRLMVRMVDDNGNIIKEFPSKEFLDMVSRIRDYVGNLLDKKA